MTASIIFVCAHYIIEKMISMRSAKKKEEQTNEYCNDFSILVSSMIVYAAPLILHTRSIPEHAGVVNAGLENHG